jgi:hypothetical protein
MDDEMAEELVKVVRRFKGRLDKVIIQEISEAAPRGRDGLVSPDNQKGLHYMVEPLEIGGGADETRTRDLRRDRPAF